MRVVALRSRGARRQARRAALGELERERAEGVADRRQEAVAGPAPLDGADQRGRGVLLGAQRAVDGLN